VHRERNGISSARGGGLLLLLLGSGLIRVDQESRAFLLHWFRLCNVLGTPHGTFPCQ